MLVPSDVLHPRRPDEHFADEARAARDAGLDVAVVDHDALTVRGGSQRAVARVPESAAGEVAVYRGWMLRGGQYEAFAAALARRHVLLRTSPEQYRRAHELPGWYAALAGVTPRSVWTTGGDRDAFDGACRDLGRGPAVVRDYSKSMKHYWHEAAFIPDLADRATAWTRAGHLLDALGRGYEALGFGVAAGRDEVFKALVLARIIEPTSKLDSVRVLGEAGMDAPSYATIKRRLRVYATGGKACDAGGKTEDVPVQDDIEPTFDPDGGPWRARLARACAAHVRLGPATLLLYDVTMLYFETDEGDGFREPGFSKERRLEPQITVGLLTDGSGFPLMVRAFEGNRAETTTMVPVLRGFLDAHSLSDVAVVADAGMVSEAKKRAIEAAGLSFILGARIPEVPYVVAEWRKAHPGEDIADGQVFVQPWPAGPADKRTPRRLPLRRPPGHCPPRSWPAPTRRQRHPAA